MLSRIAFLAGMMAFAGGSSKLPPTALTEERVVKQVRALYAAVNAASARADRRTARARFVADDEEYARDQWRQVRTAAEAATSRHVAEVVRIDGRVRKVVIWIHSQSGDWSNATEYYFYEDRGVAFRFETHLTFNGTDRHNDTPGPYVVERREYFTSDGQRLRNLIKAYAKETGGAVDPVDISTIEARRYLRVSELRFTTTR